MCIKFEGKLSREGRYWGVTVPALDIATQGKSRRDAFAMVKEAIELHVDQKGFEVDIVPSSSDQFIVKALGAANDRFLVALLLKQRRAKYGLSTSDIAKRLGITKHAYAQYEQARSLPSLAKIEEFIYAMDKKAHFIVSILEEDQAA